MKKPHFSFWIVPIESFKLKFNTEGASTKKMEGSSRLTEDAQKLKPSEPEKKKIEKQELELSIRPKLYTKFDGYLPDSSLKITDEITLYIPQLTNYPDLDFIIYDPKNKHVHLFQLTISSDLSSHMKNFRVFKDPKDLRYYPDNGVTAYFHAKEKNIAEAWYYFFNNGNEKIRSPEEGRDKGLYFYWIGYEPDGQKFSDSIDKDVNGTYFIDVVTFHPFHNLKDILKARKENK